MLQLHKPDGYKNQVKDDPLMAALAFQHRWFCLFKHVLKKQTSLGKIQDYFLRIEFQSPDSPHLHIFISSDLRVNFQTRFF